MRHLSTFWKMSFKLPISLHWSTRAVNYWWAEFNLVDFLCWFAPTPTKFQDIHLMFYFPVCFSRSDLVNGLVSLMNSNVSSPVNLVSFNISPDFKSLKSSHRTRRAVWIWTEGKIRNELSLIDANVYTHCLLCMFILHWGSHLIGPKFENLQSVKSWNIFNLTY